MSHRLYDKTYHADRNAQTRHAAETILGYVFRWHHIDSVYDIGCGVGTWLAAAHGLGASRVFGFDGPWVDKSALVIDADAFMECDLNTPLSVAEPSDLVVSLEVAEHLSPSRAPSLVKDYCRLGDLVLFSAAVPGQGGTGHRNEQWQSFWADLFAAEDFRPVDALRPLIWADENIAWWYRQNIMLYVRRGSKADEALEKVRTLPSDLIDIVHPQQFLKAQKHVLRRKARVLLEGVFGR